MKRLKIDFKREMRQLKVEIGGRKKKNREIQRNTEKKGMKYGIKYGEK